MKKFIAFEGIDGSGKSTQLRLLSGSLKKIKENFIITREPGGTETSEEIRKILINDNGLKLLPNTELLLFYASRHEHVAKVIIPNLKKRLVLCDRFFFSTFCYQIIGAGGSRNLLNYLHKNFAFNLMPDITIVLDVDPNKAIQRSLNDKKIETKFELKTKRFHKKVSAGFRKLSSHKKVKIINGDREIDIVHKNIIDLLNKNKFIKKKIPYYFKND